MKKSVKIIILGILLFASGIVFGLGGTVISMINAFDTIQESGTGDADALAEDISNSLITTAIGIPVALLGFSLSAGGTIAYFVGRNKPNTPEQMA